GADRGADQQGAYPARGKRRGLTLTRGLSRAEPAARPGASRGCLSGGRWLNDGWWSGRRNQCRGGRSSGVAGGGGRGQRGRGGGEWMPSPKGRAQGCPCGREGTNGDERTW